MDKKLKKKSLSGIKWSSINTIFNAAVTPVFYALLAILLSPKEFAYIAVINLVFRLVPILAKFGLEEAYIQKNDISYKQNSSLFTFTVILSIVISCILFLLAPFIEMYYNLNDLGLYVRLLIIAILGEGFVSIFKASLKKNFLFKQWALILMISMFLRISITIIFINFQYGVLSFVIGIIFSAVFSLFAFIITSYLKVGLKVQFYFGLRPIFEFIKFGYPITGKRLLETLNQRVDEVIIGAFFSTEVFGIYFFGKNLIMQLKTAIVKSFSMVLLPLYSELKNSITALKSTYFSITNFTAIIGFPALLGISLTAETFVPLIFGESWTDSVVVIQILSIGIMFPVITGNNATSLLYSLGYPLTVLNVEIITSIIYLSTLWLFLTSGGGIITVLIIYGVFLIGNSIILQYFVNKKIGSNLKLFISNFYRVFVSLAIMIIGINFSKMYILPSFNLLWQLLSIIGVGFVLYLVTEIIIDRRSIRKLIKVIYKKEIP